MPYPCQFEEALGSRAIDWPHAQPGPFFTLSTHTLPPIPPRPTLQEVRRFSKPLGIECTAVFGGSGVANQISELKRGVEVVACTPGRMIDLLVTSNGGYHATHGAMRAFHGPVLPTGGYLCLNHAPVKQPLGHLPLTPDHMHIDTCGHPAQARSLT